MISSSQPPIIPLTYTIAGCSEHSGRYVAENILLDNPLDQASRWSGAYQASNIKQWMLLELSQLSILSEQHSRTLTFGKYKESMILRHILKHLRQRRLLGPYHSILARTGFGQGDTSQQFEHPAVSSLYSSLVLQGQFSEAESVLSTCASQKLFALSILAFQPTALWTRISPIGDPEGVTTQPSARGGHAMCLDQERGLIYMFGGWDGRKSLQDFWLWNTRDMTWKFLGSNGPGPRACHRMVFDKPTGDIYVFGRLDEHVSADPPSPVTTTAPRSGHRHRAASSEPTPEGITDASMGPSTVSEDSGPLPSSRPTQFCSEFYRFHTRGPKEGEWELISHDVMMDGGPPLVFDHQMIIDCDTRMIYMSGGRVVDGDWDAVKYAGMYSYNMQSGKWRTIQPNDATGMHPNIAPRFGHSMVLDPESQTLFLFAGQRDDKYMADMYAYHLPTDNIIELYPNFATADGPDACFTQRAIIDPDLKEIYVFCGLTKGPPGTMSMLETEAPYWIYRYERPERPGIWTKILPPPSSSPAPPSRTGDVPLPRYAHQVVYDTDTKLFYMHGGNAGLEKEVPVPGDDVSMETASTSTRVSGGSAAEMEAGAET
ncbi:hypothetical protein EIP91_002791 [Steccherinum ochraceum]|uniref:Muskelin N-terminal domain-containing protein n=1 Tax=Steccherinum ochraceum TaxID=92696 RepID=A0A4R0RDB7_9APHY|nr:hypothetical protein EIP91_002791 [Steccherinum ochraceum]